MWTWKTFETFTSQFLKQANNPDILAEELISLLFINTFSGFTFSSLAKYRRVDPDDNEFEKVPFLNIIHHPFKESRLLTFGKKDSLFGVVIRGRNPKELIDTMEFTDPIDVFTLWKKKTSTSETELGPN
jgi:hypothetical protein